MTTPSRPPAPDGPAATPDPRLAPGARVHLVGIGGAGMSALAWILLERGHPVSGSDLRGGRVPAALAAMGARVHIGHDAAHVEGADVVAASTAVPPSNPELARARAAGIPLLRRAELLAALMEGHRRLLVAGTHGKTTTTSMATVALQAAGLEPSFAIGGALHGAGTSAHDGSGEVFVAEADESDGSFLLLRAHCAVVTNIELDHHDYWGGLEELTDAFLGFLEQRVGAGPAILCVDDAQTRAIVGRVAAPVTTYGEHEAADLRVSGVQLSRTGARFGLSLRGRDLGAFTLRIPGRHNVLNAAATVAAADWAGADLDAVRDALASFAGPQRRFQRLGDAGGVTIVDDYAHHPTEIRAVLAAARQSHPDGRIVAVFQPHRYSRTAALGRELGEALSPADVLVVTDVYASGEAPVPGVTGALVAEGARAAGAAPLYVPATGEVTEVVADLLRRGDLVLTLGAGDITELGPVLLRRLEGHDG